MAIQKGLNLSHAYSGYARGLHSYRRRYALRCEGLAPPGGTSTSYRYHIEKSILRASLFRSNSEGNLFFLLAWVKLLHSSLPRLKIIHGVVSTWVGNYTNHNTSYVLLVEKSARYRQWNIARVCAIVRKYLALELSISSSLAIIRQNHITTAYYRRLMSVKVRISVGNSLRRFGQRSTHHSGIFPYYAYECGVDTWAQLNYIEDSRVFAALRLTLRARCLKEKVESRVPNRRIPHDALLINPRFIRRFDSRTIEQFRRARHDRRPRRILGNSNAKLEGREKRTRRFSLQCIEYARTIPSLCVK